MLANIINTFDLDFIIPMSLVDENVKRAGERNAATEGTFWWKIPRQELANITRVSDLDESNFLRSNSKGFGRPTEEIYERYGDQ